MTSRLGIFAALVRASAPALVIVGAGASAQTQIPIRQLGATVTTDSGVVAGVIGVRQLPDGRTLVNDPFRRRLIVLDSTLRTVTIIADSSGTPNRYGAQSGLILTYVADSTIYVDQQAAAFVVFDPAMRLVRTIAPPKPEDMFAIMTGLNSAQGYDPQGRLIYRAYRRQAPGAARAAPPSRDSVSIEVRRDSSVIVRADPDRRTVDTVALVAMPVQKSIRTTLASGGYSTYTATNPLPQTDEWTLLPDGTVAVVRGFDYHIDWYHPDGTKSASPKLPFDWRPVTQEEKERMLDSAKKVFETRMANAPPPGPGLGGIVRPPTGPREFVGVDPADMPDYYPPIRSGTVRADRDGNVWILPTTSRAAVGGGLLYDVVNRKGELFERVQLPAGRNIAGFGPGGTVYLQWSRPGDVRLERARVVR